jgi:lysozyme
MARATGIDVSHWQGTWRPEDVKSAGKSFVFMKATEADGFTDDQFAVHWLAAKDEGLLRGAYHFWRRQTGAVAQAAHFYETVSATGDLGDLPPVLDLEDTAARKRYGIDIDILKCLHEIERLFGKKPIIYTGAWWMNDWVGRSTFGHYDLWAANYKTVYPWSKPYLPLDWDTWKFWQHSEKGRVPGVQSACDLNLFYADLPALLNYAGLGPQKVSIELDIDVAHSLKEALIKAGV